MSARAVVELTAGFDESWRTLGRDARDDRDAVVIAWPSVPAEIIRAAGFRPVVARASAAPTPAADTVLEPDLFANRHRQLVEAALTGRLADVAAIVLPRSADADYKCFLYLRELVRRGAITRMPPVWLFDLLQSAGVGVPQYDLERARDLLKKLTSLSGRRPEPDELHAQIASANRARAAARGLAALRRSAPRMAGAEALPLLGAFWQLDPERYAALAATAAASLAPRPPLVGPRVLLTGAPVDSPALHALVEAEGAVVVGELSPFGSGAASPDVDVAAEPLAALVEHYRSESIGARLPVTTLVGKIDEMLDDVDAAVLWLPSDDATFGWDYPRVRALLAQRSLPHAVVEGDPLFGATPADRARLRALVGAARQRHEARCG